MTCCRFLIVPPFTKPPPLRGGCGWGWACWWKGGGDRGVCQSSITSARWMSSPFAADQESRRCVEHRARAARRGNSWSGGLLSGCLRGEGGSNNDQLFAVSPILPSTTQVSCSLLITVRMYNDVHDLTIDKVSSTYKYIIINECDIVSYLGGPMPAARPPDS